MIAVPQAAATFVDVVRVRAEQQSAQRAFSFLNDGDQDELTLTYADLDARARAIASLLQAHGSLGERALLVYPPGLDFVAALLGCLYAGWVAVPVAPPAARQRAHRLQVIARDAQPALALTTRSMLARVEPLEVTCLATDGLRDERGTRWQAPALQPDDLAVLQYTSGSTADPRGVMLSHANLLHNTRQIGRRFEIDATSRGVIWLPAFHDMGLIGGILQGLQSGFPITLMSPTAFLRRPARWLEAISQQRATISGGPNFAYDLCVDRIDERERARLDLSCWEVAFNGAEPVRPATLERFSRAFGPRGFRPTAFYPCYGLAESTLIVTGGDRAAPPSVLEHSVSCGRIIDDSQLRIIDPTDRRTRAEGELGEVWVTGPSVAQGYWRKPDLTRDTFQAVTADTHEGPFLRTGDLGFVHAGELYITGRLKSLIIVSGRNVQAEDIEHTVATSHGHGWPGAIAAIAVDRVERERLVVVQEVTTRAVADLESVVRAIRLGVAEQHKLPVDAVVLLRPGAIPRTSSGKVRREACRAAFVDGGLEALHEWRVEGV